MTLQFKKTINPWYGVNEERFSLPENEHVIYLLKGLRYSAILMEGKAMEYSIMFPKYKIYFKFLSDFNIMIKIELINQKMETIFNRHFKAPRVLVLENDVGLYKLGDPFVSCKLRYRFYVKNYIFWNYSYFHFKEIIIYDDTAIAMFRGSAYIMTLEFFHSFDDVCRRVIIKYWHVNYS